MNRRFANSKFIFQLHFTYLLGDHLDPWKPPETGKNIFCYKGTRYTITQYKKLTLEFITFHGIVTGSPLVS